MLVTEVVLPSMACFVFLTLFRNTSYNGFNNNKVLKYDLDESSLIVTHKNGKGNKIYIFIRGNLAWKDRPYFRLSKEQKSGRD